MAAPAPAPALQLDPKTSALVLLDFQVEIVERIGKALGEQAKTELVSRTRALLAAARKAGCLVVFVRVAFRAGYPEISPSNNSFAAVKSMGGSAYFTGSPSTQIVQELAPLDTEPVVIKHRIGAFLGTDLAQILRGFGASTLVFCGLSTSGAVLSSVRYAADEDYRLVVVGDCCADSDAVVHDVLLQKVFPRQARVATVAEVTSALV